VPVLIDRKPRPWSIPQGGKGTFAAAGYHLGKGGTPLEVAVATSPSRPTESDVRNLWKRRKGNQPSPLLLVVLWPSSSGERATVCGATGDEPAVYSARDPDQVERVAALALSEPDHHAAVRFLSAYLPEEAGGLRNVSLFATYHLVERVPRRPDWPELCKWGAELVALRREQLVRALGFTLELRGQAAVLRAAGQARALAVFLDDNDNPDTAAARFNGMTPVSWAIGSAAADNIPYVVVTRGPQIRIYTTRAGAGAAGKGGTGAFIEFNLALLTARTSRRRLMGASASSKAPSPTGSSPPWTLRPGTATRPPPTALTATRPMSRWTPTPRSSAPPRSARPPAATPWSRPGCWATWSKARASRPPRQWSTATAPMAPAPIWPGWSSNGSRRWSRPGPDRPRRPVRQGPVPHRPPSPDGDLPGAGDRGDPPSPPRWWAGPVRPSVQRLPAACRLYQQCSRAGGRHPSPGGRADHRPGPSA
jgi:hypothetical protein